jgi:hypothetical protein
MLHRRRARSAVSSCVMFLSNQWLDEQMGKNEEHECTRRSLRGHNDAREQRLTCRQQPLSVPATGVVVFIVVFRLDVAVELFGVVDCAGRTRRLLIRVKMLELFGAWRWRRRQNR